MVHGCASILICEAAILHEDVGPPNSSYMPWALIATVMERIFRHALLQHNILTTPELEVCRIAIAPAAQQRHVV
jgi:predicted protein tyrosine phosphatase